VMSTPLICRPPASIAAKAGEAGAVASATVTLVVRAVEARALFTEPDQPNVDAIIRRIYELYADYVMKNPFYQIEMPIRCEVFDRRLGQYLRPLNSR